MIYLISIKTYQYTYRIDQTDQYAALISTQECFDLKYPNTEGGSYLMTYTDL